MNRRSTKRSVSRKTCIDGFCRIREWALDALAQARAALELLAPTDYVEMTAEAYLVLGEALLAAGGQEAAAVALETAETLALQKEALVLAREERALLLKLT